MNQKVLIAGAGLAGSLLAIYMAKKGFEVHIFEKRADMRKAKTEAGRSINLALSNRGIKALEDVGIAKDVLKSAIPMKGRMLHDLKGNLTFVPYGKDDSEYINSISRAGLNIALLNIAESFENVHIHFSEILEKFDPKENLPEFRNLEKNTVSSVEADIIIGTDGAGSILRAEMLKKGLVEEHVSFLEHGYKELTIPAKVGGGFLIEKNALHIWPRGTYMLIALPNLDGSFTCTLFFPNQGEFSFESLKEQQAIQAFFKDQFPDALALMPDLVNDFQHNPVGLLGTVKCHPWHYQDKVLLLGDSAHAIVPFYGQGMNASFEDCLVFNNCMEKYGTDWGKVFSEYEQLRKINTDAIASLAVENFYEMRDGAANPNFLKVRQLEHILENQYPDYHSKYSMVTFHPEISYSEAQKIGNYQNDTLMAICKKVKSIEDLKIEELYQTLKIGKDKLLTGV